MKEGIITPQSSILRKGVKVVLPSICIMFFIGKAIEYLKENFDVYVIEEKVPCFLGYRCCYGIKGNKDICFIDGGRGAPQAVDTMELVHALGVEQVIIVGMCGCFVSEYNVGDIVIPPKTYIDEGTSRNYEPMAEYSEPSIFMYKYAVEYFSRAEVVVQQPIVSTDAIYRQTFQKEELWRKRGYVAADMESSALLTVSKYLRMNSVSILLVSDIHPTSQNDINKWKWSLQKEERYRFIKSCIEFGMEMCNCKYKKLGQNKMENNQTNIKEERYRKYRRIIGSSVSGTIDRPIGSHHPQNIDLVYSVNYGYVDNVFADDGEEQDVYFLGDNRPLESFIGVVVAIYHRFDDNEDKWIVVPDGVNITNEEILSKINFQEQYFDGELIR